MPNIIQEITHNVDYGTVDVNVSYYFISPYYWYEQRPGKITITFDYPVSPPPFYSVTFNNTIGYDNFLNGFNIYPNATWYDTSFSDPPLNVSIPLTIETSYSFILPEGDCWDNYGEDPEILVTYIITINLNYIFTAVDVFNGWISDTTSYNIAVEVPSYVCTPTTTTTTTPAPTTTTTPAPTTTTTPAPTTTTTPTPTTTTTTEFIPCPCYKKVPSTVFSRPPYKIPTTIIGDHDLISMNKSINIDKFGKTITTQYPTTVPPTTPIQTTITPTTKIIECDTNCDKLKF